MERVGAMNGLRRYSLHVATLLLSIVYVVLGHVSYWPAKLHGGVAAFELREPRLASGDEPHYVMIINSLLHDHDVRLDDDFQRLEAGGYEAGYFARGLKIFGGHTLIVDERTGRNVMCILKCTDAEYAAIGVPRQQTFQVPSHPIGYPLFIALILAPFRPTAPQVEPLIGFLSIIIAVLGVMLTHTAAIRSGLDRRHALAAAVLLGFASTWIVYLRAYFADSSIGLFVLLGYLALRRGAYARAGIAVGIAIAMKAVFVMVGAAWIVERIAARRFKDAAHLAASVGLCGIGTIALNMALLQTPFVPGALPLSLASGFTSLRETFFSDTHGLFFFVPWTIVPLLWAPWSARPGASEREGSVSVEARRQMLLTILFCIAVFACIAFGPGWCYGPRYYVPLLPFLSILAIDFAVSGRRWRTAVVGVLGLVGATIAIPSVPQYEWLFQRRPFAPLTGPE